jgi:serine O-acetyltransferase
MTTSATKTYRTFQLIKSDFKKIKRYGAHPLAIIFLYQGFWAIFQYRISRRIFTLSWPKPFKIPLKFLMMLWQKAIEIITGICIPPSAIIGHSFYIGHFGNVIINANAVIGNNCNISQGCTIGVSGRGAKRGVPVIGDNVYIGANAVVAGCINVGNNVVVGALSLALTDVPDNAVISGVPAIVVNFSGSEGYI